MITAHSFSWVAFLKAATSTSSCRWSSRSLLEWSRFCSFFQRCHASTWLSQRATSSLDMGGFSPLHPQLRSQPTWYIAPTALSNRVTLGTIYENISSENPQRRDVFRDKMVLPFRIVSHNNDRVNLHSVVPHPYSFLRFKSL